MVSQSGNGFRGSINPTRIYRCKRVPIFLIDEIMLQIGSNNEALAAVTTDNGIIFAILFTSGLKSILSCLVGARLIFMLHIIIC